MHPIGGGHFDLHPIVGGDYELHPIAGGYYDLPAHMCTPVHTCVVYASSQECLLSTSKGTFNE